MTAFAYRIESAWSALVLVVLAPLYCLTTARFWLGLIGLGYVALAAWGVWKLVT